MNATCSGDWICLPGDGRRWWRCFGTGEVHVLPDTRRPQTCQGCGRVTSAPKRPRRFRSARAVYLPDLKMWAALPGTEGVNA